MPMWGINLRSILSEDEWDDLRRAVYKRAGYRCEICGGRGPKWPVECHEQWEFDDRDHVQRLVGLIALCPKCHRAKHIGLTTSMGKLEEAVHHMMEVNGWTRQEVMRHIDRAKMEAYERSRWIWELDLSLLGKSWKKQ